MSQNTLNWRNTCTKFIVCLTIVSLCSGGTLNNMMDLHNALFVNSSYNRDIRGLTDQSGVLRVGAIFSVISLGEVMELEEAFSVMGLLILSWTDERFIWTPSDYNDTSEIVVYQDRIWKPEVNLANPMMSVKPLGSDRRQVKIYSTGRVSWLLPEMYTAACNIDVVSYPWDRQSCSLNFVVSTYSTSEVIIEANSDQIRMPEESKQWDVVKTSVMNEQDSLSQVKFWWCLERRPSFHMAVILVPIFALSFLNVFVFFVKVDSGERISFSITLLLSITLYLSMTADTLPSHSKGMSAIIYCLNFILVESMLICILSIFSLHVFHKQGQPSVTWQRIAMKLLGRGCDKVRHTDDEDAVKTFSDKEIGECKKDPDLNVDDDDENLGISWMDISLLMDRIFSLLAVLAILISFSMFAAFVVSSKTECI